MQNLGVACIRRPLCPGFRRRLHCLRNAQSAPFPPLTQAGLAQSCPFASFEHYFAFVLLVAFSYETHEPAGWLARAVAFIPCANAQSCPLASFKRYFVLVLLVAFSNQTHPFCLGAEGFAYVGFSFLYYHVFGAALVYYFHSYGVARAYLMFKFYVVYCCKEEQASFVKFFLKAQCCSSALCHCFYKNYSRNYWIFRKVSFKEKIFFCKFACTYTAVFVITFDCIHKQKRFSVR